MTYMRSALRGFAFLSLVFLSLLLLCETSEAKDCFGSLRKPLTDGGYSGSLDCRVVDTEYKKFGSITIGGKTYVMYDLLISTIPEPGLVPHGSENILVFLNTNPLTYLGTYNFSQFGRRYKLVVTKNSIKKVPAEYNGLEIVFTEKGPPLHAVLDGDLADLYR